MLIPALLSVLIALASVSVILQVRILTSLTDIASNPMLRVGSTTATDHDIMWRESIPVTITNGTLDVNVENSEFDVNVQNEPDVNMRDHYIIENDPIPVKVVK